MERAKQAAIIALVCLDAALLLWLALGVHSPTAQAQGFSENNYVVVTARLTNTQADALYVIDLNTNRMAAFGVNRKGDVNVIGNIRDLSRDFQADRED